MEVYSFPCRNAGGITMNIQTTAPKVISTVEAFLAALKIGDKFWHMTTLHCRPTSIQGPLAVVGGIWTVEVCKVFCQNQYGQKEEWHVGDIANKCNKVFLTAEDAQAYFEERKLAYETDPKLIAQYEQDCARSARELQELDSLESDLWLDDPMDDPY